MTNDYPKQILIMERGFSGVYTARHLEQLLRPEEASITLINRENYWVYQPTLPEVISESIGLINVVSPIRRLCRRINVIMRVGDGWHHSHIRITPFGNAEWDPQLVDQTTAGT